MGKISKIISLFLVISFALSSLIIVEFASGQSTHPAVIEFTIRYADHSYDVAPVPSSSTDPYTGETTTTTIPGYHVENKTVDITIKNPPGATYYNFRWKGTFDDEWRYCPYNPNRGNLAYFIPDGYRVPFQASNSAQSTFSLYFLPKDITPGGSIDVQVQVLYGNFRAEPYGHAGWVDAPTYDFYFEGETSDWSSTQTFQMPQALPSPTVPEFSATAILPLLAVIPLMAAVLLRQTPSKKTPTI